MVDTFVFEHSFLVHPLWQEDHVKMKQYIDLIQKCITFSISGTKACQLAIQFKKQCLKGPYIFIFYPSFW